jgi:chromosome segregation ATPase
MYFAKIAWRRISSVLGHWSLSYQAKFYVMDLENYPKSHPSILLLNEIDILLAQLRLLELYLKQAHSTAALDAARLEQQHQDELGSVRAALAETERLALNQAAVLTDQLQGIQGRFDEKERLLDQRDRELDQVKSEHADLRAEFAELELAHRNVQTAALAAATTSQNLQAEIEALRHQLGRNQQETQQQQESAQQTEHGLREQLAESQAELSKSQAFSQNAVTELDHAGAKITELQARLVELQASCERVEFSAARELEHVRSEFEKEIAGLQSTLAARGEVEAKQEAMFAETEANLQVEIAGLRNEIEQKHRELESRDGDWRRAQAEIDRLRQRVDELDTANISAAARESEFETIRCRYENETSELRHAIEIKDRELTQRQEAAAAVEIALHDRLRALQEELSRSQGALSAQASALEEARAEITALRVQIGALENCRAEAQASSQRLLEETRQHLEQELNQLRASVAQKDSALKETEKSHQDLEERFGVEIAELRERNRALEQARREAEENWQRSGDIQTELQTRLKAKTDELDSVQATANEIREQLDARISELQLEIAQKQLLAESRNAEIGDLKDRVGQLAARLADAKSALSQQGDLVHEAEQIRLEHHNEIARLNERHQTELENLASELARERENANHAIDLNQEFTRRTAQLETELEEHSHSFAAASTAIAALEARLEDYSRDHERHQAEAPARAELEAELTALRHEFQRTTSAFAQQEEIAENQSRQIHKLEALLAEQTESTASQAQDLATAQGQAAALQQRIRELEDLAEQARGAAMIQAEQVKQDYETRLDALHAALAQKNTELENISADRTDLEQSLRQELQQQIWALAQQQAAMEQLAQAHQTQLQNTEAKFREQQNLANLSDGELEKAVAQARALQHRVDELEVELRHAELTALRRDDQTRQDAAATIEQLNSALEQKSRQLEQLTSAQSSLEQSLRQELDRVTHDIEERDQISRARNEELVRAKADLEQTHNRLSQLETSTSLAAAAGTGEIERMRGEFQTQLSALQAELSQKDRALQERSAQVSGLEQEYRDQVDALRRLLAEKPLAQDPTDDESAANATEPARTATIGEIMDPASASAVHFNSASQYRRWRSGFASKRRWKL